MNANQRSELWTSLRIAGIVDGDLPADEGDTSPWYVRAMVGAAAWIAALFLIIADRHRSFGAVAQRRRNRGCRTHCLRHRRGVDANRQFRCVCDAIGACRKPRPGRRWWPMRSSSLRTAPSGGGGACLRRSKRH